MGPTMATSPEACSDSSDLAQLYSPERLERLLAEVEALQASHISDWVRERSKGRRQVRLGRMRAEECLRELREAQRRWESLALGWEPWGLPEEAAQERLLRASDLGLALIRRIQALRQKPKQPPEDLRPARLPCGRSRLPALAPFSPPAGPKMAAGGIAPKMAAGEKDACGAATVLEAGARSEGMGAPFWRDKLVVTNGALWGQSFQGSLQRVVVVVAAAFQEMAASPNSAWQGVPREKSGMLLAPPALKGAPWGFPREDAKGGPTEMKTGTLQGKGAPPCYYAPERSFCDPQNISVEEPDAHEKTWNGLPDSVPQQGFPRAKQGLLLELPAPKGAPWGSSLEDTGGNDLMKTEILQGKEVPLCHLSPEQSFCTPQNASVEESGGREKKWATLGGVLHTLPRDALLPEKVGVSQEKIHPLQEFSPKEMVDVCGAPLEKTGILSDKEVVQKGSPIDASLQERPGGVKEEVTVPLKEDLVSFEEVAVHFTEEEGAQLDLDQRKYMNVMVENYEHRAYLDSEGKPKRHSRSDRRSSEMKRAAHWSDQTPNLEDPEMSTAKKVKTDRRPFQEAWTESFGMVECNGKALCLLCNRSVVCRTSSVRRHLDTNHKSVAQLGETERKELLEGKVRKYLSFCNERSRTNHLTAASFQISFCIAKYGQSLSDGDITKTAVLSGSNSLFHDFPNKDKIIQRISEMPLSRNTVKDRVQRMASDVSQQLIADLQRAACYSMCLDGSTDRNNHARLAVILRYAVGDTMREEMVKLVSLPERAQGIDIYNAVMEAFLSQGIRPEKVVSITSDGAPNMVGATAGFVQFFIKETKHQVIQFHCIIHQGALSARESSQKFDSVLTDVTEMVNYIMACALNFQQFQALLEEVQAQYHCLLMHNNVRWLSKGQVLQRFVACLDEIRLFMNEKGEEYPQLTDMAWLTNLMFLTDFTLHFNALNKQLQGVGKTAEMMFCDIKAFERKLQVFERDIESGQLKYFPNLKIHLEKSTRFVDNPISHQEIYKELSSIVAAAKVDFSNRFLQFRKMETTLCFLSSPDKAKFEELDLSCLYWLDLGNLEMELLEFQESSIWKNKFYDLRETLEKIERMPEVSTVNSENEILKVWNSLPDNFKSMKALGTAFLTLFGSSNACERLFSALNYVESDTRNRLTDDLSAAFVALRFTKYAPRLDKLSACIQQQKLHYSKA